MVSADGVSAGGFACATGRSFACAMMLCASIKAFFCASRAIFVRSATILPPWTPLDFFVVWRAFLKSLVAQQLGRAALVAQQAVVCLPYIC